MFDLLKGLFHFSAAPRVVHSLPGRVRLNFPVLEKLSSRWHRYSEPVAEIVKIKQGIQTTSIQPATGNVLITYDACTLSEKDIYKWLESIVKIFIESLNDDMSLSDENFESLLNRVKIQLVALEK